MPYGYYENNFLNQSILNSPLMSANNQDTSEQ